MSGVELDFTVQYTECNLADERVECKPILRTFLDANVQRSEAGGGIFTTHLDEHDLSKVYEGTLKGETINARLPETTCIGFSSKAQRRNEFGVACYTSAGTAHVRLDDVLAAVSNKATGGGVFDVELPLLMETTRLTGEPIEKGKIRVRVTSVRVGPRVKLVEARLLPLGSNNLESINEDLAALVSRRVEREMAMPDTWPGIKGVRMPMDISSAGIESTKLCFLPVEGFVIGVNVGYYQNALEVQLARRNLDLVQFAALDLSHKAEVLAEVLAYAPQNYDYIGDSVDTSSRLHDARYSLLKRMGIEDFTGAEAGSGDCEDLGKIQLLLFDGFQALTIDKAAHPQLHELQQLSHHYVGGITLATVHGAKVDDKTEKVGAHAYFLLLPKTQVKRALLAAGPEGAALVAATVWPDNAPPLPTLIGEGTGRIRPLGHGKLLVDTKHGIVQAVTHKLHNNPTGVSHDPLFAERRYLSMSMRSKGGFHVEIPRDAGAESNFYLGHLAFITNHFLHAGHNVGAFICTNVAPGSGDMTRGARFTDVINQEPVFGLLPCEPLPDSVMAITRAAVMLREPHTPFTYNANSPAAKETAAKMQRNPLLDRLCQSVALMKRTGVSPYGSVDLLMRPHQFNAPKVDAMLDDFRRMQPVYRVDYVYEAIKDRQPNYRLRVFMDHDAVKRIEQ